MLRIGLTGGIGSGKTTVAKIFEVLGIPVYYADDVAKQLMTGNEDLKQAIITNFGAASYIDEKLNRSYLAGVVFNDPEKLSLLNSLVHPAVIADVEKWMKEQTAPYAIKEAALIFESGAQNYLDQVIGVNAPYALRLQRAMLRDNITKEEVELRMEQQIDETKKMNLCDFLINNNENELLIPQVLALHEKLLGM